MSSQASRKKSSNPQLDETLAAIRPVSAEDRKQARKHLDSLTKPQGSLGRLEEWAERLYAIRPKLPLSLKHRRVFVLAADHGVAAEGVSAYPQEVTGQMIMNFLTGGAAINVLARHAGAKVKVVDMGVVKPPPPHDDLISKRIGPGTRNMVQQAAMTHDQAAGSLTAGIEILEEELAQGPIDMVAVGEMGIANTTAASALIACLTQHSPLDTTGLGTGIKQSQLNKKINAISRALERHKPDHKDPVDCIAKVGGFEIGGIAGIALACARHRIPVIADGVISTAGCLIATRLKPEAKDYLFSSHLSLEPGHQKALAALQENAMFDMQLRLGEGTGAVLAMGILDASARILSEMATFESAGVSQKGD